MHMRCSAYMINLIVKEGLKRLESSIVAIRNAVKFVRSSPSRLSYFKMCVETEKIECKGLVEEEGDDERIEGIEGSGKGKGKSKTNKRVGPPSDEDWEKAMTFVMFLKTFYDVTLKISASLHPTSHSTFHDLLAIDGEIRELHEDIPGAIFLEYTASVFIQSVVAAILARIGMAQDFCSFSESVSALSV
ncbi:unnamed protein product [Prunus armeniaca]